ncbi:unnamed protein product [Haemonchus placei]|uniref:S5A_REDUCTASE domain-containing protein n=1 Tax=Haemonchus placei TaxID=6290 RepID=A0A0N4W4J9_HAEPC|nr:unnamed protein product [Haemonchus placei]
MAFTVSELIVINWLSWLMIISGVFVMVSLLLGMRAVYGRYTIQSSLCSLLTLQFQFTIQTRYAWFIQELPSFVIPVYYIVGCRSVAGFIVLAAFIIHYFNRTFIYPFQLKSGNGTPWFICLSAIAFCSWNGYLQGSYHGQYYDPSSFFSNCLTFIGKIYACLVLNSAWSHASNIAGVSMFAVGMFINIHSDSILRSLRKPGETGYKIPRGGLFEYVSGANFFGEIVEWAGFAIMSGSLPAMSFAIFTACNIGPRAIQHHHLALDGSASYGRQEIEKGSPEALNSSPLSLSRY